LGQQKNGVAANFRRPDFLEVDQDFLALAEIADDTPTAYHSRRVRVSAGLERRFDRTLTGGVALGVEKANVVQLATLDSMTASQRTQHYALVGVPMYLKLDRSDDLDRLSHAPDAGRSTRHQGFLAFSHARALL
jgi:hypothetical protein